MHIRQTLIRALALALTLLLVLGSTNPALAVQEAGMTVTKIDNDALDARLEQPIVAEPGEEAPYGDTDMVRVSILLEKKSTLEAGFSTTGITQNDAAMAYRETLRADQETVTAQISQALQSQLSTAMNTAMQQMGTRISQQMESAIQKNIAQLGSQMENALKIDASAFQNAIHMNMAQEELAELMKSSMLSSTSTYDGNLQSLGYADLDDPSTISIYPKDFDCKALIVDALDAYNASAEANGEDDKVVRYTDVVGTLMTSVTKIINMISNMLVAFVSISLVVSSIMIGVITYISVLERRKEIGILRAIGASKRNISEVFNAETFIIGLCSGCMGVGLSLILLIPGNMLIHSIADSASVTAALPLQAALVLIALATLLTILGGLIPAKSASKCDPVKALRSE